MKTVNYYKKQIGLTLVELLIAMLVGIFVIGGVLSFFMQSNETQKAQHQISMLRENADFALSLLVEDIQLAGYFGCATRWNDAKSVNVLNDSNNFEWNYAIAIQGSEYLYDDETESSSWAPALDSSLTSVEKGDVITIRRADRQEYSVVSHSSSTDVIYIDSGNRFQQEDFLLVTDCENSAIFQKTNSNYTQSIAHTLADMTPGNASEDIGKAYSTDAKVMELSTISYYIRNNSDGLSALYRKRGGSNAEEVISGIEELQLSYGIDRDGDYSVDEHLNANDVESEGIWDAVLTVRVELLARTIMDDITVGKSDQSYYFDGQTYSKNDGYLRMVVSADITLRNRMI